MLEVWDRRLRRWRVCQKNPAGFVGRLERFGFEIERAYEKRRRRVMTGDENEYGLGCVHVVFIAC